MAEPIVIIGAGGFGREVIDVIEALNAAAPEPVWDLAGSVDDAPSRENLGRLAAIGTAYLGSVADLIETAARPHFVVGIGSPEVRRRIASMLEDAGFPAATLIHPAATLGRIVTIGGGTVVCAGARVTTNVTVGRHVHLNPNVTVGHDTTLGDFVSMNPASSVSGDCAVEDGVLIGVAGVVLNGLTVGASATVGGSACAIRDVAPRSTVVGVPARPLKSEGSSA